jgi:hypothetical protein
MSYSTHRRKALDATLALHLRAAHARSCAVHISQKYSVSRQAVIDQVWHVSGVHLLRVEDAKEVAQAVCILDRMKAEGMLDGTSHRAEQT